MFQLKTVAVLSQGCFSVFLHDGVPFAVTLERTFDNGRPVIPAGRHLCRRSFFIRGGYATYEIELAGHSRLLFHKGNVETDSEGCILVAESFGLVGAAAAILDSKGGFNEFMDKAAGLGMFELEVLDLEGQR